MSLSSRSGPSTAIRVRAESDTRMNAAIASVDQPVAPLRRRLHTRQRRETLCVRQRPLFRIVCMTDAGEELAVPQERVNLREALHLARRHSFENVHGLKMAGVSQSSRSHQFAQGGERALVKLARASGLVVDHEGPLAPRVLRRDAGWATVGMTGLRLDAAQRKHKAAGCIAPIGSERQQARDIETGHHPPARAQANGLPQSRPHQAVVGEHQTFPQRRADVVDEFERCRAGAALRPVDNDEVWTNSSFQHGLAERHELPGVADAELEADRLAAGQVAQLRNEVHHLHRGLERRVARRRDAIDADRHTARVRDLRRHLGTRQHTAVARLGPLRELDLDHLDLPLLRLRGEPVGAEGAVLVAAAEIAAADLPDQVTAEFAMIAADAALAGIVGEAPSLAPRLRARMAFALSAPKLMAEMLKSDRA